MKKITIAIDGFSSTGKSTLAKQLAQQLGYVYVDTGAMYRAVTLYAMQHEFVSPNHLDAEGLTADLNKITLHFVFNSELGYGEMYLNGVNVEREIRTLEVSSLVSKVAEISAVRTKLVEEQQAMGKEKGVVMDGRDIGTVVFPDAALKIYMTASPATRAQRRFSELQAKGDSVTYEEVLQNVNQRDYIDTHRADSPLVKAEDAIELDNSNLGREDQLQLVMEWVAAKTKSM
ncbi:(d)CMP kinase [Flavobacterium sp.]|uniref:(d)CMP kinase n=1 Tax=Flavobacterium sp. TaxID=239 RepID=UPI00260D14AE|nr:(d)CMP kinase [Flavobacterium sp.]